MWATRITNSFATLSSWIALDVIPEFLLYYRVRDDGRRQTSRRYHSHTRVLRNYETRLREIGMAGLATFAMGVHNHLVGKDSPQSPGLDYRPESNQAVTMDSRKRRPMTSSTTLPMR